MFDKLIYDKLTRFCAYQERCKSDVLSKLYTFKIEKSEWPAYTEKLEDENYLNEDRFVKAFVAAHTRKKWGKAKIKSALSGKRIPASLIKKHLDDMDVTGYNEQIKTVAEKKLPTIKAPGKAELKTKLMRFLLSKGYEMDKILPVIRELKL